MNRDLYFNQFWSSLMGKLQRKKKFFKNAFPRIPFQAKNSPGRDSDYRPAEIKAEKLKESRSRELKERIAINTFAHHFLQLNF